MSVYHTVLDLAGKPISIANLKVGDKIKAATLFGWFTVIVESISEKHATCYTEKRGTGVWLNQDDSGFWEAGASFNPDVVCTVSVAD